MGIALLLPSYELKLSGDSDMPTKQYWFPAKKYGWGWGMPLCWQGWCVLAAYTIPVILAALLKLPDTEPTLFWLVFALQTLVFL